MEKFNNKKIFKKRLETLEENLKNEKDKNKITSIIKDYGWEAIIKEDKKINFDKNKTINNYLLLIDLLQNY